MNLCEACSIWKTLILFIWLRCLKRFGSHSCSAQKSLPDEFNDCFERFHLTQTVLFQVPGIPTVAAASAFAPEFDLAGQQLNTLRPQSDVTDVVLNVLPAQSTTWVVFTYHKRHRECLSPFFSQLASLDQFALGTVLSKMIVMHCENVVLSPAFVDGLSQQARDFLEQVFNATIYRAQPYVDIPDVSLFGCSNSNPEKSRA
jgi:hypothetical protein